MNDRFLIPLSTPVTVRYQVAQSQHTPCQCRLLVWWQYLISGRCWSSVIFVKFSPLRLNLAYHDQIQTIATSLVMQTLLLYFIWSLLPEQCCLEQDLSWKRSRCVLCFPTGSNSAQCWLIKTWRPHGTLRSWDDWWDLVLKNEKWHLWHRVSRNPEICMEWNSGILIR